MKRPSDNRRAVLRLDLRLCVGNHAEYGNQRSAQQGGLGGVSRADPHIQQEIYIPKPGKELPFQRRKAKYQVWPALLFYMQRNTLFTGTKEKAVMTNQRKGNASR